MFISQIISQSHKSNTLIATSTSFLGLNRDGHPAKASAKSVCCGVDNNALMTMSFNWYLTV